MAPSRRSVAPPIVGTKSNSSTTSSTTTTTATNTGRTPTDSTSPTSASSSIASTAKADAFAYSTILRDIWNSYQKSTPQSLKLIDIFMAFLVFSGVVQFTYCVLVGNYPFNAFLSGFIATVGQFVLAAGLRSQCNIANATEFPKITPERAFGDFLFSSIVLHFAVVNFLG